MCATILCHLQFKSGITTVASGCGSCQLQTATGLMHPFQLLCPFVTNKCQFWWAGLTALLEYLILCWIKLNQLDHPYIVANLQANFPCFMLTLGTLGQVRQPESVSCYRIALLCMKWYNQTEHLPWTCTIAKPNHGQGLLCFTNLKSGWTVQNNCKMLQGYVVVS